MSMTRCLEESNGFEREEKKNLEDDIRLKQEEVAKAIEKAAIMEEKARQAHNEHIDTQVKGDHNAHKPRLSKFSFPPPLSRTLSSANLETLSLGSCPFWLGKHTWT